MSRQSRSIMILLVFFFVSCIAMDSNTQGTCSRSVIRQCYFTLLRILETYTVDWGNYFILCASVNTKNMFRIRINIVTSGLTLILSIMDVSHTNVTSWRWHRYLMTKMIAVYMFDIFATIDCSVVYKCVAALWQLVNYLASVALSHIKLF